MIRLPPYLTAAYGALIGYASLHPMSGWRAAGVSPFAFLEGGWPRYWTIFDLTVNTLAYLPLGFFLALTLRHLPGRWLAVLLASLLGGLFSFSLEALQTFLPSRIPSHLDLACNALGSLLGALLAARSGSGFFKWLERGQQRLFAPLPHIEAGLVLLALWLLTQLSPEILLFGTGDLRQLLGLPSAVAYAAHAFFVIETGITVCNTLAIGLLARILLGGSIAPWLTLPAFFSLALVVRTLAAAILIAPQDAFSWLTPGATLGLLIGAGLLPLALLLPDVPRLAVCGLLLMAGTVLVNLTPPNPYSTIALATWRQGHFLNFNGLTRLSASLWPFFVLPYLTLLARRS